MIEIDIWFHYWKYLLGTLARLSVSLLALGLWNPPKRNTGETWGGRAVGRA